MEPTSQFHRPKTWVILILTLASVLAFSRQAVAVKKKKESGFLAYLFEILSADEVPVAPTLSPEERESMYKLDTLLQAQNQRAPVGGNYVLLAALAAARNDLHNAVCFLNRANCHIPNSSMPATMKAQFYAQAGDFERAKAWHCVALKTVGNPCQAPALGANSYMDLAVAYAQSGDIAEARRQLHTAESVLARASRDHTQAALGWLQMGIVYTDSLQDDRAALDAWKNGSMELESMIEDETDATLKIDLDVRIADSLIAEGQYEHAAGYLESASTVVSQLSAYSKPEAQFQIGSSYVELAAQHPDNSTYAEKAAEQLAVLTEQDSVPPGTLGAHRDAALAHAKLLKTDSPEKAEQLIAKALKWTLEIGELNSAYKPVFSPQAPSPPALNQVDIELILVSSANDG